MGLYQEAVGTSQKEKAKARQTDRKMALYTSIYRDMCAILKLILPNDKHVTVANHIKSIMYAAIELKTGVKPRKF